MHVLFVHGAGFGATSFDGLRARLTLAGVSSSAPPRRGYDDRPPTGDLDVHVSDLAAALRTEADRAGGPVTVAGVSGGATLALALAIRQPAELAAAIVHEPLLGPLAPVQHDLITASIDAFLAEPPGPASLDAFLRRLVGSDAFDALPPAMRHGVHHAEPVVRTEAPGFAAFPVAGDQLRAAAPRLCWTVGTRSPRWRHDAAQVAADHGVEVREIDARHTPQIENPDAWLDLLMDTVGPQR